ncbi:ParB N-terminal domain-containing protein [Paraburkholderia adhaesiva]|uniref:ParB N-terminal domain-containing protein n=1 Tax=Paraburkholderia adhaesiva TaxID=2883244 RepID=UPI001F39D358|nr:ParB N-terminal domain-containing protein [Paraburkholderia adhaesiva]
MTAHATDAMDREADADVRAAMAEAPVSRVTWIHRDRIRANAYNPNRVAPPELELLILSILEDGFTQPLVVLDNGDGSWLLVDGYHRWIVSDDARIVARYGGFVPVVQIDADPVHRMMSTIRHNRARGTHAVLPMADIVRTMIVSGVALDAIGRGLGMEGEEINRLADRSGMPRRVGERGAKNTFGHAWVPE